MKISERYTVKRGLNLLFILLLIVIAAYVSAGADAAESEKISRPGKYAGYSTRQYKGISEWSFYLTMRDGVRIAVDLYLPDGLEEGTKLPTILFQTRYVRSLDLRWPFNLLTNTSPETQKLIELFVPHGYAWVDVDARGSGASFGSRQYPWSPDEVKDGGEIVDWIIAQPWSDGNVGSLGWSYTGSTSEFLLVNNHPAVKAVAPRFALFDTYTDIAFPGGIHSAWFTEEWARFNNIIDTNRIKGLGFLPGLSVRGPRPVDIDRDRSLLAAAIDEHAENLSIHEQALSITFRDDVADSGLGTVDVFSPHSYIDKLESSGAAIYSFSGWFDGGYQHAAIKRFLTLSNPGKLLIGPWDHSICIKPWWPNAQEVEFDFNEEMLRFFDYHLKGIENGVMTEKPVCYYTLVEEKWKFADTWPPAAEMRRFYFAPKHALDSNPPADADGLDSYEVNYDTGTRLHSRWVSLVNVKEVPIQYTGRKEEDKKLLCYTSVPLAEDMEVTGHPVVTLQVTSTATDGNFIVYLEDVHPSGEVTYVTEGHLRAIHRKLSEEQPPYKTPAPYRTFKRADAMPLVPGEPAQLVFDLLPTSYLFLKGHSIRLAIAGADKDHFPLMKTNPPTILNVHRSQGLASFVDLPVVGERKE
ncbi:MAG: CocE/NonD family hydrolase [Candidatus Abyssobacteria bacterium SURF_5]|uniref:CocE/NonD family hydrolase n=1 Tax=Abyssobacteria bacterium (strain SURF_5) TaxID=2093360 RepID=A0A3A4NR91_ABYX5|nr:MAG: CocE/NonD family hydrolase [Candidatus Abyssubacteria bacterium SURF_5]